jgi:heme-binding NEAT domain protein
MTKTTEKPTATSQNNKPKEPKEPKEQTKPNRVISDPKEVAQLVMMRIDHVNSKKDELTIAVKALADTTKQLVSVYANQQAEIAKLAKRVQELEKPNLQ